VAAFLLKWRDKTKHRMLAKVSAIPVLMIAIVLNYSAQFIGHFKPNQNIVASV
jgi:hypothetical protein